MTPCALPKCEPESELSVTGQKRDSVGSRKIELITADGKPMYLIRLATLEDVPFLPEIEHAAGQLFSQFPALWALPELPTPIEEFHQCQKSGLLWVAALLSGRLIGFAQLDMVDGLAHLDELDVHPDYGRQGIGTKMVQTIIEWARSNGIPAVTLTTFRDVPWNEPFYRKLGFRVLELEELSAGLIRLVEEEESHGLDRALRVVMKIETGA